MKIKGTTKEMLGFVFEVILFLTAGMFILLNMWIAYFFLILALIMAHIVGKQIAANVIEKYKGRKDQWK